MTEKLRAFDPIAQSDATHLILGSMPGVASLEAVEYYAHPRNGFWPIIHNVYGGSTTDYKQKVRILIDNKIAVWDVLSECEREGSLDSNIKSESIQCNNFNHFLQKHTQVEHILFNGKTAERLFRKHVIPKLAQVQRYSMHALPSSSPAMASLSIMDKTRIWSRALPAKRLTDS